MEKPLKMFNYFPNELVAEILQRLPVKSLLKFKCVSKSWLSLISSSQFIKSHLKFKNQSFTDYEQQVLFFSFSPWHYFIRLCYDKSLVHNVNSVCNQSPWKIERRPCERVNILGYCDGLICIANGEKGLILCNPSIRQFKNLPEPNFQLNWNYLRVFGLGYDEFNDDYKVVVALRHTQSQDRTQVHVYSLKRESWKRIEDSQGDHPSTEPSTGMVVNGKLHWKISRRNRLCVASLDLATEAYGEVEEPNYEWPDRVWALGILGGNLCLFSTKLDLWVMAEYGVKESWNKVFTIFSDPFVSKPRHTPLCTSENGKILLMLGFELVLCNIEDGSIKNFQDMNYRKLMDHKVDGLCYRDAFLYVESLLSPYLDVCTREALTTTN